MEFMCHTFAAGIKIDGNRNMKENRRNENCNESVRKWCSQVETDAFPNHKNDKRKRRKLQEVFSISSSRTHASNGIHYK